MNKLLAVVLAFSFFVPSVSFAATLTQGQVNAIMGLLQAFNVSQTIIAEVQADLTSSPGNTVVNSTAPTQSTSQSVAGSSSSPVVTVSSPSLGLAPQFVENPIWSYINGDRNQGVTAVWTTDIPSTSVLLTSALQGPTGDLSGYSFAQSWVNPSTSFIYTNPILGGPEFFAVQVTANDQTTTYIGSDHRKAIPH